MSRTSGGAYQSGGKPVEELKPPPKGPGLGMLMAVPWVDPMDDRRCEATVLVMDDRMGGWTNRCRLMKGHGGYHRHPLDACDPLAFMAWQGTRGAAGEKVR